MKISEMELLYEKFLEILGAFVDQRRKQDLIYFLAEGTFLGTVREDNIIPWDDDIDVSMQRDDHEKLTRYFVVKRLDGYKLCCHETASDCSLIFAKFVGVA